MDSYRALVLKPEWEKPYFRCAEAWIKLGEIGNALTVNVSGRTTCSERADLDKQYKELQTLLTATRYRESFYGVRCSSCLTETMIRLVVFLSSRVLVCCLSFPVQEAISRTTCTKRNW